MNKIAALLAAAMLLPVGAQAAEVRTYYPAARSPTAAPGAPGPAFSSSVLANNTLYVSGVLDIDPATGKPGTTPEQSSKLVMDAIKRAVEGAGLTMDDLVWVQIFATDLTKYAAFNGVYRTYFKGDLPARAFLGTDKLLFGANFEVMAMAAPKGK